MLPITLLLVSLAQQRPDPLLFTWGIEGLGEPRSATILITVTPTPFGLTQGFVDVKTITLTPVATREDPRPRAIHPLKTEPAPRSGLRASFTRPDRRFRLTFTFLNGSTHTVDPWAPRPADLQSPEHQIYQGAPEMVAPPGLTARWGSGVVRWGGGFILAWLLGALGMGMAGTWARSRAATSAATNGPTCLTADGKDCSPGAVPDVRPASTPTVTPSAPATSTYDLALLSATGYESEYGGHHYVEGRVKNISDRPLQNVTAMASWFDKDGEFIKADEALIDYNPILPGAKRQLLRPSRAAIRR
jgi:hypothetical protein